MEIEWCKSVSMKKTVNENISWKEANRDSFFFIYYLKIGYVYCNKLAYLKKNVIIFYLIILLYKKNISFTIFRIRWPIWYFVGSFLVEER